MLAIALKAGSDPEDFKHTLELSGYAYWQGKSLTRIFTVEHDDIGTFLLKDHLDIKAIDDLSEKALSLNYVDTPQRFVYGNDIYNDPSLPWEGDGWALMRICRRKNPFPRNGKTQLSEYNGFKRATRTGLGVDIYICDVGTSVTHAEFEGRMQNVNNTLEPQFLTAGYVDHGTSVASCAGGKQFGVATDSLLWSSSIGANSLGADTRGFAAFDDVLTHYLSRAGTNRPAVMNLSIGTVGAPTYGAALGALLEAGICITVSASNYREDHDSIHMSPAEDHPDITNVGASAMYDTPMAYHRYGTAYGSPLDLFAPGEKIRVAGFVDVDNYHITNGTSFAAPYTCGVIACMLQGYQRPTTLTQVQSINAKLLENSTKNILDFPESSGCFIRGNNRLLYIDPHIDFEVITGLTPL